MSAEPLAVDASGPEPKAGSRLPSILLGLLGGVVVLAGVWFLFLAPDSSVTQPGATGGAADPVGESEPLQVELAQSSTDVDVAALPVVTYDIYLARDPFEPVVEPDPPAEETTSSTPGAVDPVTGEPTPASGTPVPEDPAAPGSPAPGTDPGTGQPLPSTDGGTSGSCTGQEELVCDGRVVSLLGVTVRNGERVATIQVGTDLYEVAHGEVFASYFRVVEFVSDTVVRLQYGELIYEVTLSRSMK
jgi:hypothetical protein